MLFDFVLEERYNDEELHEISTSQIRREKEIKRESFWRKPKILESRKKQRKRERDRKREKREREKRKVKENMAKEEQRSRIYIVIRTKVHLEVSQMNLSLDVGSTLDEIGEVSFYCLKVTGKRLAVTIVRVFPSTRAKIDYLRWDLAGGNGGLSNSAVLVFFFLSFFFFSTFFLPFLFVSCKQL